MHTSHGLERNLGILGQLGVAFATKGAGLDLAERIIACSRTG
jgi:hypothetical protein